MVLMTTTTCLFIMNVVFLLALQIEQITQHMYTNELRMLQEVLITVCYIWANIIVYVNVSTSIHVIVRLHVVTFSN